MSVERESSRAGLGLTAAASLLGAAGTLLSGGGVALLGVPLSVAGVYRCSRRLLVAGVVAIFLGAFAASRAGVPPGLVVLAMAGAVLAWDLGENAISLAEQLRTADTGRLEVVHAATSTFVVAVFAMGGYVVFLLSTGGQPTLALALLVLGAVVVLAALE